MKEEKESCSSEMAEQVSSSLLMSVLGGGPPSSNIGNIGNPYQNMTLALLCYCLVKNIFSCFLIGSGSGRIRVFSPIRIRTRGPGSDTLMMYDYIVCSGNNHNTTSLNFYNRFNALQYVNYIFLKQQ